MKPRYRVVHGTAGGYRLEVLRWWWPFWTTVGSWYYTVTEAEEYAKAHAQIVVKYIPPFDDWEGGR